MKFFRNIMCITFITAFIISTTLLFAKNPIATGADPHAVVLDGKYWFYPTVDGREFRAHSSQDLVNWIDEGVVFDLYEDCKWTNEAGWAPAIAFRDGKYYFYYSANGPYPNSKIGVAVGNSPKGRFIDHGILASSDQIIEAIDPMVFTDDDNQAYLYYGGSGGGGLTKAALAIHKLNDDMVSLKGSRTLHYPTGFVEAPFIHKRNNFYYLTYSNGDTFDTTYNVQYAIATSPMGPWVFSQGSILSTDENFISPGHQSVIQRPGRDEWYIFYHRYQDGINSDRKICIEQLFYDTVGEIFPITMTNSGVSTPSPPIFPLNNENYYKLIAKHSNKALDAAIWVYRKWY
ncbi:MAG: family 43 glycosylhydrolase [Desulfobacterales bacterium]|nr:family 43 glycosylhydrolase [Desulfobacterales bacterium]